MAWGPIPILSCHRLTNSHVVLRFVLAEIVIQMGMCSSSIIGHEREISKILLDENDLNVYI